MNLRSVLLHLDAMPTLVFSTVLALLGPGLYFYVGSFLVYFHSQVHLPLLPRPLVGMALGLLQMMLGTLLYEGKGWVRPLLPPLFLAAYPLEYGWRLPATRLQWEELAGCLVLVAVVGYGLYRPSATAWFSRQNARTVT